MLTRESRVAMDKVEKIENEIRTLTAGELAVLRLWLYEYDAAMWDSQLETDIASGKLDSFGDAALDAHRKRQTTEL
jgi:hypothetical protein